MIQKLKSYQFLFEELVKRDFSLKYKRTFLGVIWSALNPLLTLCIMAIIFTNFFGQDTPHYFIYLSCGNLIFDYFRESTNAGMTSLSDNAGIFSKVMVPKSMFVITKNVASLLGFAINLVLLAIFIIIDGISIKISFLLLLYPIVCLVIFNIGMSFILSTLYIMFKDLKYLYSVFTRLLMYLSAIFYPIDRFPEEFHRLFYINPVYVYISYFRTIIIDNQIPSLEVNVLAIAYAAIALGLGVLLYRSKRDKFFYYI